jgi:HSP20 family protein
MGTLIEKGGFLPFFPFGGGMGRMFEDFFKEAAPMWTEGSKLPAMDIKETAEAVLVEAELPGMKKEDIKVTVDEGVLTIAAERTQEKEEKGKSVHRSERYYGRMQRSLALPPTVDGAKVEASYKDGVLHVTLPKKPAAKGGSTAVPVK